MYETLKNTWSRKRRIIGKAEHLEKGSNPRFIVTSINDEIQGQKVYEDLYCSRGNMENRIKEQQLYLFSDRTSSHELRANQLRLWFSSIAYLLIEAFRRFAKGTEWAKAQCHTIRNKVLKIGATITISVRRVLISFASGYPHKELFALLHQRLQ